MVRTPTCKKLETIALLAQPRAKALPIVWQCTGTRQIHTVMCSRAASRILIGRQSSQATVSTILVSQQPLHRDHLWSESEYTARTSRICRRSVLLEQRFDSSIDSILFSFFFFDMQCLDSRDVCNLVAHIRKLVRFSWLTEILHRLALEFSLR